MPSLKPEVILETSLVASLKDYGEFTLKTCFNNPNGYIGFLHSSYDYEIEESIKNNEFFYIFFRGNRLSKT
jgi:hypothetical protein